VLTGSTFGGFDVARIAPKAQSIRESWLSVLGPGAARQIEKNKKTNTGAKYETLLIDRILFPPSIEAQSYVSILRFYCADGKWPDLFHRAFLGPRGAF
jgi:hypothetical protein